MSQLLFEQLEFANLIVLNKTDQITTEERGRIRSMLSKFNPKADIVETSFGQIDPALLFGVARFDMNMAATHPQWLQEARIGEHKPETEEYGISSFTFRARIPFHPLRLHDAMKHALKKTDDKSSPLAALVRMKGVAWIAPIPELQAVVTLAGKVFSVVPSQPWWDVVPRERWPPGLAESLMPVWRQPYGDRQVEISCIGQYMDKDAVDAALRSCLLTDEEIVLPPSVHRELPNPYEEPWSRILYDNREDMMRKAASSDPSNIRVLCLLAEHLRSDPPGARHPSFTIHNLPTQGLSNAGTGWSAKMAKKASQLKAQITGGLAAESGRAL